MVIINGIQWEKTKECLFDCLKNNKKAHFRQIYFQCQQTFQIGFFQSLTKHERSIFYHFISPEEFSWLFTRLTHKNQRIVNRELPDKYFINMLNYMVSDDLIRYLRTVNKKKQYFYLPFLKKRHQRKANVLLAYRSNAIVSKMTMEYIFAYPNETIRDVIRRLKDKGSSKVFRYVYVITSTNQLIGVVSLRTLMIVPKNQYIYSIMKRHMIAVRPHTNRKKVKEIGHVYNLLTIPIVSKNHHMIGVIHLADL